MTQDNKQRNLGPQPIAAILAQHKLSHHDLVVVSPHQLTHKMVSRAVKGRWLTPNTKSIILNAVNSATGKNYCLADLFNY